VACKNLGWSQQYAAKTKNDIDISTWFLLDTSEQRHEILTLWQARKTNISPYMIDSAEELTLIRSLPREIKNHTYLQKGLYKRTLTFNELMKNVMIAAPQDKHFLILLRLVSSVPFVFAGLSFLKDKKANKPFGTNLLKGLATGFGFSLGITTGLGSLFALAPFLSLEATAGISGSILLAGGYNGFKYNPLSSMIRNIIGQAIEPHGAMSLAMCAFIAITTNSRLATAPTITKPLDEI